MTFEDRVRLVYLVDTALALASLELGRQPALSYEVYSSDLWRSRRTFDPLAFQVNHNDSYLFERGLAPLIDDEEMRALLVEALLELGPAHFQFQLQMLESEASPLDEELELRGLTGAGLALKFGGQRRSLQRYGEQATWLGRRKWFRSALRWTDIVLGSLSSIPVLGVAVDPLKEWKESVEAQLDSESGRRSKKR